MLSLHLCYVSNTNVLFRNTALFWSILFVLVDLLPLLVKVRHMRLFRGKNPSVIKYNLKSVASLFCIYYLSL